MILAGALGALALFTLGFDVLIDQQRNPNQRPATLEAGDYVEVALEANRQDHYVANALINGSEVEIMVDTGATQVAISEGLARRLSLPQGAAFTVSTANGTARAYATRITSIRLGPIEMRDISAAVVPNMSSPDVLLGMNFLRELELVQREGRLVLRQYR
ncbi:MAG: TIGR02281 family clan AA aspartic protease [Pseudomonadota bacterium]